MKHRELIASIKLVIFDFDGVFTDNTVYVDQNGVESVRCWRSDGLGLSRIRDIGVHTYIVSTETNPVVMARANKLKIDCRQSVDDKAAAILDICSELNVAPEFTMFVGNDINDILGFNVVGAAVAVADSHEEVLPHVLFKTTKPGGLGAVREVCDLVYHARRAS